MNSGVTEPPVWMAAAVAGAERATARIDEVASVPVRAAPAGDGSALFGTVPGQGRASLCRSRNAAEAFVGR